MAPREIIEKQNSNSKRMAMEEEFTSSGSCSKRRKICDESSSASPGSAESVTKSAAAAPASLNLEAIDLKLEKSETVFCMISNGEFSLSESGESSHQSKEELKLIEREEMESPALSTPERQTTSSSSSSLPKSSDAGGDAGQMPSAAEIEDFFSAAEKYQQERFAEKYNYDVVKDVPVEGRYKWIPLKL